MISLYEAIATGWRPPEVVDDMLYKHARTLPDEDPLKGFVGFACSYGGKYFGGRARASKDRPTRNYATESARVLIEQVVDLRDRDVSFARLDFLKVEPFDSGSVLYLDPPYYGTTGYSDPFDHRLFYERVQGWAQFTDVFVSEHSMPWGNVIMEFPHSTSVAGKGQVNSKRVERLYHYGPGEPEACTHLLCKAGICKYIQAFEGVP